MLLLTVKKKANSPVNRAVLPIAPSVSMTFADMTAYKFQSTRERIENNGFV